MFSRILGFLVFAGILVAIGLNFKTILHYGEAKLVETNAKNAIEAENWPKAVEIYESGLHEHPHNMEIARRLGLLYQQTEQTDKAAQLYQSMLKIDPDNLEAQIGQAQVAAASPEHFNDAVIAYRKALKNHSDDPELLNQIGNLYRTAAENPQETREPIRKWLYDLARYYYQVSLTRNPKQFQTQFNLGVAYQHQDNLEPAAKAYCEAIVLAPDSYEARYNLGLVLTELNYLDEAYRQMGQAVQLASEQNGETAAMGIAKRVQNIKNSIYNNSSKQGLSGNGSPDFLNKKCLVTFQSVEKSDAADK